MFENKNKKTQEPPKQKPSLFGFSGPKPKPKPDKDKEWEELIWMDEILDDDD